MFCRNVIRLTSPFIQISGPYFPKCGFSPYFPKCGFGPYFPKCKFGPHFPKCGLSPYYLKCGFCPYFPKCGLFDLHFIENIGISSTSICWVGWTGSPSSLHYCGLLVRTCVVYVCGLYPPNSSIRHNINRIHLLCAKT